MKYLAVMFAGMVLLNLVVWCIPVAAAEQVTVSTRDELEAAVRRAKPGTTILVAPGEYRGGLSFNGLRGAEGQPIIVTALDHDQRPVFRGGSSAWQLTDPMFVELRHLIIEGASGNGLNIDDGGSFDTPARHVVLRGLTIRDIGPKGNRDGIKLSGVNDFLIDSCEIERWGDGGSAIDMVGCQRGQVVNSVFRYRSDLPANGVQMKGGSREISVQRCRFENAGSRGVNIGGSTGLPYFRPQPNGFEAQDITVEDCTFSGSQAPICFVGVDRALVRYNTIYRPTRYVLRILQETTAPEFVPSRHGVFQHNVIVFRSNEVVGAVKVGAGTAPETFRIENNHWYCLDRPDRSRPTGLPVPESGGSYGIDPQLANPEQGQFEISADSPVRDAGVRPLPTK